MQLVFISCPFLPLPCLKLNQWQMIFCTSANQSCFVLSQKIKHAPISFYQSQQIPKSNTTLALFCIVLFCLTFTNFLLYNFSSSLSQQSGNVLWAMFTQVLFYLCLSWGVFTHSRSLLCCGYFLKALQSLDFVSQTFDRNVTGRLPLRKWDLLQPMTSLT